MDKILVAWIWNEANGGSGRSVGQIEIERGVVVSLVYPSPIAKLIICNQAIRSLFRGRNWLFHLAFDALLGVR
jgi:hypothetical protein